MYVNSVVALPLAANLHLPGVPLLLHVHEGPVGLEVLEHQYPGLITSIPDRYVAVSELVAKELSDAYRVPPDRISVIPPFAYIADAAEDNERPTGTDGPFVVGGVGNPSWYKGHHLWVLMARELAEDLGHDRVRFVWAGVRDNDEGRYFRAMVSKAGLADIVDLVPEIPDLDPVLRTFDVLAISSWEESASLAALEAMARGVPVVCFAGAGGPAELIADAGIALPAFSVQLMAAAVMDLVTNENRRRELGEAGRERVRHVYAQAAVVRRISEEIAVLIGTAR